MAKDHRQVLDFTHGVQCRIGSLQTGAVVLARITLALIDVLITVLALVTSMTFTEVILHLISAPGSIGAWIRDTLIDVQFTILPFIASAAAVAVKAAQLVNALTIVQARSRNAVIDINVTDASSHARYAGACKIVDHIDAGGAVRAGITNALIDVDLTVLTLIARFTVALVGIDLFQKNKMNIY